MTDNEIIMALECCHGHRIPDCDNCPNEKTCNEIDVLNSVIDLINRQKAEIERLKNDIEESNIIERENEIQSIEDNKENATMFLQAIKQAKSEAIKEFAEMLKKRLCLNLGEHISVVTRDDIDNFVKEMTRGVER